jgi:NTP pyrophosphatase (non-canonical NTP hydrolase)
MGVTAVTRSCGQEELAVDQGQTGESTTDSGALRLRAAQAAVDETIQALGGYWPPLANLARLFEECGELARAVNQATGHKRVKLGEAQVMAREELGDALYVLLVLANSLDVDAAEALSEALAKARRRAGSGANKPSATGAP